MKNVDGLIKNCEKAIKEGWKYVFGAKGQVCTREDIEKFQQHWGKNNVWDSDFEKAGQICCDCSGLISSYTGIIRNSTNYKESATQIEKIEDRKPEMRGWGVWMKGHIGVYDGNDGYYAMDGSDANAVHKKLDGRGFTHIIKLCDITY